MPRHVILEHNWNGVHWDFMLEVWGVLKTWAIDAPIRPNADLPARGLGDHRLAYLDYEGPVSGGRGHVSRWDQGTYDVECWQPDRIRVRLQGAQVVGVVELTRRSDEAGSSSPAWVFRLGNVN